MGRQRICLKEACAVSVMKREAGEPEWSEPERSPIRVWRDLEEQKDGGKARRNLLGLAERWREKK